MEGLDKEGCDYVLKVCMDCCIRCYVAGKLFFAFSVSCPLYRKAKLCHRQNFFSLLVNSGDGRGCVCMCVIPLEFSSFPTCLQYG